MGKVIVSAICGGFLVLLVWGIVVEVQRVNALWAWANAVEAARQATTTTTVPKR